MNSILASAGWGRNTIDSVIYPMKGSVTGVNGELGLPAGKQALKYAKTTFQHTQYLPTSKDQTLRLAGELGVAAGYGGITLPFMKNFYAGGIGSVRGYEAASLGPVDTLTDARLGGAKKLTGTAEYLFRMPGLGQDKSVRLGVFLDGGQVWGTGEKIRLNDLRYSSGLSANWASPFGPLKFSFAKALNAKSGDKKQVIQFTMGSTF